jgi:hypothetical protein
LPFITTVWSYWFLRNRRYSKLSTAILTTCRWKTGNCLNCFDLVVCINWCVYSQNSQYFAIFN